MNLASLLGPIALSAALSGCSSMALLQTAHTAPPRAVRIAGGPAHVGNEYSSPSRVFLEYSMDVSARLGITESLDLGITPFMAPGAAVDGKFNLIRHDAPFALAPRLRLGGGTSRAGSAVLVESGVIASYRWFGWFEPYLALGFANYWVRYNLDSPTPLAPNQRLAARRGYGDGLLQGTVGFDLAIGERWGLVAELRYWLPMQNDPGDNYAFVDSRIVALALRYQSAR